jgi:hypothetical protein
MYQPIPQKLKLIGGMNNLLILYSNNNDVQFSCMFKKKKTFYKNLNIPLWLFQYSVGLGRKCSTMFVHLWYEDVIIAIFLLYTPDSML